MDRTPWTDRKFTFDFPEGWIYDILERLRGTHVRMLDISGGLTEEQMEIKPEGKWSIKEHLGHLGDLEELHMGRLEDFIARKEMLRAADMSNAKTNLANHNGKSRAALIENFIRKREPFISALEKMDDATQLFKSTHPRLKTFMRPVDVAFFTAEHDDHHLASIREIISKIPI